MSSTRSSARRSRAATGSRPRTTRSPKPYARIPTGSTGFARVDPNLGAEACDELDRALGELGLAGLFLHPWEEVFRISAPLVDPVLEAARSTGRP